MRYLLLRKSGRMVVGMDIDTQVQVYLKKVRESGSMVSVMIAMAAAKGLLLSYNKSRLAEYCGHVMPNRNWAYSLLRRMNFVK